MSNRALIIGIVVILGLGALAALLIGSQDDAGTSGAPLVANETESPGARGAGAAADTARGTDSLEVLSASPGSVPPEDMLDVGDVAPNFSLERLEGGTFDLSQDGRNRVVLVNFWATWCEPCRDEAPDLQQLHEALREDGLLVVGVSLDQEGREVVEEFHATFPVEYPLLLDGLNVAQRYGAHYAVPTSFVIGREGRILDRYVGAVTKEQVESSLRSAVAG